MARYCQAIHDANKLKRVIWVNQRLEEEEQFQDLILTNECTVQLECHRRKSFWQKNAPRKLKHRHKHPPRFTYGAAFSKEESPAWYYSVVL